MQAQPTQAELNQKLKAVTKEKDSIFGVRMGAGDRSYLVRNNKIDVFKNRFGGVEVGPIAALRSPCNSFEHQGSHSYHIFSM